MSPTENNADRPQDGRLPTDPWPAVEAWQEAHQECVAAYAAWVAACETSGKQDAVPARLRLQVAIDVETEAEKVLATLRRFQKPVSSPPHLKDLEIEKGRK